MVYLFIEMIEGCHNFNLLHVKWSNVWNTAYHFTKFSGILIWNSVKYDLTMIFYQISADNWREINEKTCATGSGLCLLSDDVYVYYLIKCSLNICKPCHFSAQRYFIRIYICMCPFYISVAQLVCSFSRSAPAPGQVSSTLYIYHDLPKIPLNLTTWINFVKTMETEVGFFWNHHKCLTQLFLIHLNTYVMGLRPL